MAFRCPRCASTDHTEELDDGRAWAECCRIVFQPTQPPRLVDPEPRTRRDTDG